MKIRLLRIFNLFRRDFQLTCLTLGGIFFLLPLLLLIVTRSLAWWTFLLLFGMNLIWFLTYLLGYPSVLWVWEETLEFAEYYEIRKGDRKRVHFSVSDVRDVEFLQTRLERLFDVGRIRFRGEAETEPALLLNGTASGFFQIAGIPHFSDFRRMLEARSPAASAE